MKKISLICIAAVLMMALGSGLALAYTQTYDDYTYVKQSNTGTWQDIVGDSHYDVKRIDVTWSGTNVIIGIHTNDNGTPEFSGDYIADFAIDKNRDGVFESGIVLKAHDSLTAGYMYTLSTATLNTDLWKISDDFPGGGWGTDYDRNNLPAGPHSAAKIPVLLKNITYDSTFTGGSVSWPLTPDPDGIAAYLVTITLTGINTDGSWDHFDFLWGTETCGNDTEFDHADVPLPGSVLLLGTGLLGLVGLRWRKVKDGLAAG